VSTDGLQQRHTNNIAIILVIKKKVVIVNGVFFWLLKLCNKRYKKGKVKLQTKNTNLEENLQEIN
jgi:hypothetical protein